MEVKLFLHVFGKISIVRKEDFGTLVDTNGLAFVRQKSPPAGDSMFEIKTNNLEFPMPTLFLSADKRSIAALLFENHQRSFGVNDNTDGYLPFGIRLCYPAEFCIKCSLPSNVCGVLFDSSGKRKGNRAGTES